MTRQSNTKQGQKISDLYKIQRAHRLAVLGYLLYGLGIMFGITALIGVIINHTCLQQTKHTVAYSHCMWQIVSFWVLATGIFATVILWPSEYSRWAVYACLVWWLSGLLVGAGFLMRNKSVPWITHFACSAR